MPAFNLDLPQNVPTFEQRTELDGVDYVFRFVFSERRQVWTFSMTGPDDEQVIGGQTIQLGVNFLRRSTAVVKPPGLLFAFSNDIEDRTPPGLGELGTRVDLVYFDESEFSG